MMFHPPVKPLLYALMFVGTVAAAAEPRTKTVTLDVKDEDVRVILQSMQKQCGIRNLLIDREVNGAGTIYFRDVECATAFRVVLAQFGLAGQMEAAVMSVEPRSK